MVITSLQPSLTFSVQLLMCYSILELYYRVLESHCKWRISLSEISRVVGFRTTIKFVPPIQPFSVHQESKTLVPNNMIPNIFRLWSLFLLGQRIAKALCELMEFLKHKFQYKLFSWIELPYPAKKYGRSFGSELKKPKTIWLFR